MWKRTQVYLVTGRWDHSMMTCCWSPLAITLRNVRVSCERCLKLTWPAGGTAANLSPHTEFLLLLMYRHHRISEAHWPASLAGSILSTQRNVSVTIMCAVLNNSPMKITGPIGLSWPKWLHLGGGVFFFLNLELPVFKSIKQSWVQDVFFWFPRVVSVGRTQREQQGHGGLSDCGHSHWQTLDPAGPKPVPD